MYKYQLISTFNRSDYGLDTNAFTIVSNYAVSKKVVVNKDNIIQTTDYFVGLEYEKSLTNDEVNTIKKFYNFDEEVENGNLDDVVNASENSYFLYDNQNLIRETFISEIEKKS